ncbi:MAG TPA: hypothetical protein VG455_12110 [Acidimicrobiales bacterium]|nr:hypothetical protein [Acidimicrobiales bacterium]
MPATKSARKATKKAKESTRKAAETAKESAATAAASVGDAASSAKEGTVKAAGKVKGSTTKAVGGVRATRKAKAGMVEDARRIAEDAGAESAASDAIAEAEALHYQVEVNKRGLSVTALTKTLNERWANGWRLAHVLEQRGNTVLVFERRG